MPPPALLPADVLAAMLRADPSRPRVTAYDDARGERIELSAKTLANWVAKAANLLQEQTDASPGVTVGLALPPHWRAFYWALAAWSTGTTVVTGAGAAAAEIVVTDDPAQARRVTEDGGYAVLVTLAALARNHPQAPPDVVDEARELPSYADQFAPWESPEPAGTALRTEAGDTAYDSVVAPRDWPARPRVRVSGGLAAVLTDALAAWAMDGSIVLIAPADGAPVDQLSRLSAEHVSIDLADG